MEYAEALINLFEFVQRNTAILGVMFNRSNNSFIVIDSSGVHTHFENEFR